MQGSPVQFEFEDVSPVEKRVNVEVAREQVNAKLDEGFKQLGRQVNLRGFRKGKAPRSLLESMFGKKVAEDASRELVNESISFVIGQQQLRVVSEPMLDALPAIKRNEPLRYTARIELMPQIDVKDYVGLEVTQRAAKAGDEQVQTALERKRQAQTELRPVEGRDTAAATDVLNILLTGTLAHLTYKDKEMSVDLTRPNMSPLPGLAEALAGIPLAARDHELKLTMPTEGLPPELAGKTGTFKITVQSAHQKHLPELDDDFAKDTGEADSLAELKEKLRKNLVEEDAEEAKHEMRLSLVEELLQKGIAEQSRGAVVCNVDGAPAPLLIRKADGSFLYGTTDLATIEQRMRDYQPERVLYVVGIPQQLHFQQVFFVARKMGFDSSLEHISFGSMRFKDQDGNYATGSTRKGNVPLLDEFLDMATEHAAAAAKQKNADLSDEEVAEVARVVGIGAIKYNDLSRDRSQDINFDIEKALSLEGNTAPYMQYAYARLRSIARRAATEGMATADAVTITEPAERRLVRRLLDFSSAVETVARTARPHHLCEYLFDLAGVVSNFYNEVPVLKAEPTARASRLWLLDQVAQTLRHGLSLLGISVPERM